MLFSNTPNAASVNLAMVPLYTIANYISARQFISHTRAIM